MEKNKTNENVQSRRQFFKRAVQGALPILGAALLSQIPFISHAQESQNEMGCKGQCRNSCSSGCAGGCAGGCGNNCKGYCRDGCERQCGGYCRQNCSSGCAHNLR